MFSYATNNFSTKKFDGNIRDYFSWFENVGKLLDSEGLKFAIIKSGERGFIPCQTLGNPLIDRINAGTADEKDYRLRDQVRTSAAEYQAKCRRALLIVVSTLDSGPLARTENTRVYPNADVEAKDTILKTMEELKTYYGTWSPKNQQSIADKMYQLVPARTPAEVEKLARILTRINGELRALKSECALSDSALKARLIEKMHCDRLRPLFEQIADDDNQGWTYEDCMIRLNKKIDSLATIASTEEQLLISPPFSSVSPVHLAFSPSPTDAFVAAAQGIGGDLPGRPIRDMSKVKCFNCENLGHYLKDCQASFCKNCLTFFKSLTDPQYHHPSKCPKRPPSEFTPKQYPQKPAHKYTHKRPRDQETGPVFTKRTNMASSSYAYDNGLEEFVQNTSLEEEEEEKEYLERLEYVESLDTYQQYIQAQREHL